MILIEKDKILELPCFQQGRFDKENGNEHYKAAWETFKIWIDRQPTYDTDKVIEAVKDYGKYKGILKLDENDCEDYVPVSEVCRIIRNGGL